MSNDDPGPAQRKLGRIPLSKKVLWQTVRMQIVPPLVLAALIAAIAWQWNQMNPGGVPGIAEGTRSVLTSPQAAFIAEIRVQPYQQVEAGQPLVLLTPADPRTKLDLLQSHLQITRLRGEPSLAARNAIDFERLRVDQLRLKEELAISQINLQRSENALRRSAQLLKDKLISEDAHEVSLRDRDADAAEVKEKRSALAQLDERLSALSGYGETDTTKPDPRREPEFKELESKLREAEEKLGAVTLVAPVSGMVHAIDRQPGDFLGQGEPILTVYSAKSERVVAYLRQPYPLEPHVGMKVEVLTKTYKRQRFFAEISQVGAQLERITNSLAVLRPGALVDMGLPIVVDLPPQVAIRPGEVVDLSFVGAQAPTLPITATSLKSHSGL